MICEVCKNECMVDHVEDGKPVFVCINWNCNNYLRAIKADGKETATKIKENNAE